MQDHNENISTERHNPDPWSALWTTEREQHVIVVPDSMETDPVNLDWIAANNPFECSITLLGKRMAREHIETTREEYCSLLLRMITANE